ncbi:hypothetical protein RJ639_042717 [Escallonia herrerae]|uniref:DC1 domain-containing protein n=1 Tax=Escallonia herrerae TaxID=1293975 RepID=A0AA88WBC4_9ASTE|nr:hypothetical protein RJ639_042717 [Escallonia herrerae]
MELQHFSHRQHPLFFREIIPNEDDGDGEACRCDGCLEVISGAYYGCSQCKLFLHKLCAELPQVIEHPVHPEHPLILNVHWYCLCNVCDSDWENFAYSCSKCEFDMDIICASAMERKIDHPSHEHPLTPVRRTALLRCDACGQKHEGTWYQCTTCVHFWIHRDCASLPTTIERSDHKHPLTLGYTLPSQHTMFDLLCDICRERLRRFYWVYYCGECQYFTHVMCAPSKIEPLPSIHSPGKFFDFSHHFLYYSFIHCRELKVLDFSNFVVFFVHSATEIESHDSNRLYLPPDDINSVSVINFLLKGLRLGENERAIELNHFSHDHPLILFDVQTEESESRLGKNFKNDDILCEACVKPVIAPFYKCSLCNFVLHKCCAELPTELQHPFHPQHQLILRPKFPEWWGLFRCQGCGSFCNGFAFGCVGCEFYLDVSCGSLPSTIKHEAHRDHLLHFKENLSGLCNACAWRRGFSKHGFGCIICDFELHAFCSQFPRTLRHKYDEHSLILTYSPGEGCEADEYYCEICEEEMNPRRWGISTVLTRGNWVNLDVAKPTAAYRRKAHRCLPSR